MTTSIKYLLFSIICLFVLAFNIKQSEAKTDSFSPGIYVKHLDPSHQKVIIILNDAKTVIFASREKGSSKWMFRRWEVLYWDIEDLIFTGKPFDFEKGVFLEQDTVDSKKSVGSRTYGTGNYRYKWLSDGKSFVDYAPGNDFNEKKIIKAKHYYSFIAKADTSWQIKTEVLIKKLNLIVKTE